MSPLIVIILIAAKIPIFLTLKKTFSVILFLYIKLTLGTINQVK